jgi:hypothetical protein
MNRSLPPEVNEAGGNVLLTNPFLVIEFAKRLRSGFLVQSAQK